ncbi:hypothetical protein GXB85_01170 [Cellulomonas sp. APG4]|uniref:zinc metallochaperone AztD n=1 Tax=Cellulomonas sp. APG4 TaxID=1538656 RepID=UPI00137B29DD|nr:zinc metallochaperone AztD [Cellulomonas sp. APG4]NCT89568.1 hypothetical protein [Cellulomonas sp. APG4]
MTQRLRTRPPLPLLAALAVPVLALAACSTPAETEEAGGAATVDEHEDDGGHGEEAAERTPRLAAAYDGGLLVLDGLTLELVADLELPGFNRLNPAGDGRHVLVSTTAGDEPGFQVLDLGTWAEAHGDHSHYFTAEPELTDVVFPAATPGHAIPHGGVTTLFDDATGEITFVDPTELGDGMPEVETASTPEAHHGFAFRLDDGGLVTTVGDDDSRTGIVVTDAAGTEVARSEDCPGVHGEAVAADEVVIAGCEDGVLIYAEGEITKVASPDAYGRIGNQFTTHDSPVALGDYKHDPDGGLGLHEISLIDTAATTLEVVHLPEGVEYTYRDLGRGPEGEALVLGTDGALHVLDEVTGEVVASHPVIDAWEVPAEWQTAHPTLKVLGETAYVTDPANQRIHAVDIPTGEVYLTGELPAVPNEIAVVSGG